ncbi:MAG: NAD(P)-binding domain-containing protein [Bauldia sp.]
MKVAVLGTGMVGRAHAARLSEIGVDVIMGTGDIEKTMASTKQDAMGNPPFNAWYKEHAQITVERFSNAARHGEVAINALSGAAAVSVLRSIEGDLEDKILIDISVPLDFSFGFPPRLSVCNDNSLGEEIQKALPRVKVVKTLNTITAPLQVDATAAGGGDHTNFVAGNDPAARARVAALLREWYGWADSIDLGDITNARGTEMYIALWVRLLGPLRTPMFNVKIVK